MINTIKENKNNLWKYIAVFILLSILNIAYLTQTKNDANDEYIEAMTKKNVMAYQTIYNQYKQLSNVIYTELMLEKQISRILLGVKNSNKEQKDILRQQLFELINTRYENLTHFHLRQLHFHLPNNESFLRFHRPEKFGDNLTGFRKTVEYVNKYQKPVDGFEEGRIYNGFRFVYPIINNDNIHLGSVEVSFGADAFISSLMNEYDVISNFFIKKEVVDEKVFKSEKSNYMQSCQEGFLYDKNVLKVIKEQKNIEVQNIQSDMKTKKTINKLIEKQDVVSQYDHEHNWLVTAIAFHNPITKKMVAFLTVRSKSIFFEKMYDNYIKNLIITEVLFVLLIWLVFKEIKSKNTLNQVLEKKVKEQTKHLEELNATLEKKVNKAVKEVKQKDKIIISQSRHAAMGEMISMIAHQWRQPLSVISMSANNMKLDIDLGECNPDAFVESIESITDQINYLSKTIDDFRDFFKPNKIAKETTFDVIVEDTMNIIGKSLENNNIAIEIDIHTDDIIKTYSNELSQVLINIINNSKEAMVDNNIENPRIIIECKREQNDLYEINITDNAGGIPLKIAHQIYEPYFSTKHEKNGTGLGLYMSKTIVEDHLKGKISHKNTQDGVKFIIELPQKIEA